MEQENVSGFLFIYQKSCSSSTLQWQIIEKKLLIEGWNLYRMTIQLS